MKQQEIDKITNGVRETLKNSNTLEGYGRLAKYLGLEEMLEKLTPHERKILRIRFGLEDGVTHTLEEVGQEFGVTRERIRIIEQHALINLKSRISLL